MEFELIEKHFSWGKTNPQITTSIGDDCATLQVPKGHELAISTDTLVEGLHFPNHANPEDIAWRALCVNLSDLAAMGAEPLAFTLAITLPKANERWLSSFSQGLKAAADTYNINLIGGEYYMRALNYYITSYGHCTH